MSEHCGASMLTILLIACNHVRQRERVMFAYEMASGGCVMFLPQVGDLQRLL